MTISNLRQNPIDGSISWRYISGETHQITEHPNVPGTFGFTLSDRPDLVNNPPIITEDVSGGITFNIVNVAPLNSGDVFISPNGMCMFTVDVVSKNVKVDYYGAGSLFSTDMFINTSGEIQTGVLSTISGVLSTASGDIINIIRNRTSIGSKRQCVVTGGVTSGVASFLTTSSNLITLNATPTVPVVATWANGFDPFPVDYAYKWTSNATNVWGTFAAGTYYLYIDYDPDTDTVSYGSTTVVPNDDLIAPSHGAGVHWFDQTKYKMYESVAGVWTERIRLFVGEAISNGSSVTTLITYALNGRYRSEEVSIPGVGIPTSKNHNIGSNKLRARVPIICKTSEHNYSVGDITESYLEEILSSSDISGASSTITRLTIAKVRGAIGNGTYIIKKTSGNIGNLTAANWRYIFIAERIY